MRSSEIGIDGFWGQGPIGGLAGWARFEKRSQKSNLQCYNMRKRGQKLF